MFQFLIKELILGNSIARAMMNFSMREISLYGEVVDVGGGRGASYLAYMQKSVETQVSGLDLKEGKGVVQQLNFETDRLPRDDASVDQVLMMNILEHIYHHQFLIGEVSRILKTGGVVYGFVPFLVNYHPDPHDYFRYTKEALLLILSEGGFKNIKIKEVGRGPFAVNLNNIVTSLPRAVRIAIFPFYYAFDSIVLFFRPQIGMRYPLGYLFEGTK